MDAHLAPRSEAVARDAAGLSSEPDQIHALLPGDATS